MNFDLHETKVRNCDFSGSTLEISRCISCVFVNCNFDKALMYCIAVDNCVFKNCTFENAKAVMTTVVMCDFHNCGMTDLRVEGTAIADSNFISCYGLDRLDKASVSTVVNNCTGLDRIPMTCPKEGEFYAYKAVATNKLFDKAIAKIRIPADAKRSSGMSRKCRCSKAEVVYIRDLYEDRYYDVGYSIHNLDFVYKPGETVEPVGEEFDENRWHECSSGIHFFMTEEEAIEYAAKY